eukprot:12431211-Karenia_brevis.AAC.1
MQRMKFGSMYLMTTMTMTMMMMLMRMMMMMIMMIMTTTVTTQAYHFVQTLLRPEPLRPNTASS